MKRITAVIAAINSKYIHSSLAPWYLLAGIERYCTGGVTAAVVEGTVNEAVSTVAARIVDSQPDVVGLGCYIWNIAFIKRLLQVIREALPDAVIMLGGPEVSHNAGEVLRGEPLIDYVLSGEGERPFALLLDALADGVSPDTVPGLSFRRGGDITVSPPYFSNEDPPDPYSEAYLSALGGRIAYLETSRGCPFSCAFCLSGREGGIRYFDLNRAKRDLLLLAGSGALTVKLVDRTFNANKARARALFRFILDNYGASIPPGVRFHFELAGDLLDDETLALLEPAPRGLFQLEIGLQSFNAETLAAVRRRTDVIRLKENIKRLVSFGNLHTHIDLIAGLPYEDMASFERSFNTAYGLRPHMLQLGFLKLLHGAPMREEPLTYPCRYSPDPPYAVISTPWLMEAELSRLRHAEDALERLYNSGRFRRTLNYVLEKTGMKPLMLFLSAGEFLAAREVRLMALDDFTALMLGFFGALPGVDGSALRDAMACDRLTTAAGRLPPALRVPDGRLKQVMTAVNTAEKTRLQSGVRRSLALLAAENAAVWVDYTERDPVTGEYRLNRADL